MELARLGAADVFALKIAKSGGIFGMLRTAAVGDAAGIALYGGTMLEGASARSPRRMASARCRNWRGARNCSARCW
jgi:L-alanine-DL-glutamate epimerase-like enolase superfamily enzyme